MKIAYFIMAHTLERQFEWLFRAVWTPHDVFLVHIDLRCPDSYLTEIRRVTAHRSNVYFLTRRPVVWAGWSMVETAIAAIRFLCEQSSNWRYFINLSGQDYPSRSAGELHQFLQRNEGANFLDIKHIDSQPYHIRRRLHWYCFESKAGVQRFPIPNIRAIFSQVQWHGEYWVMLNREFCKWLIGSKAVVEYRRALMHAKIPDEFFFQSLIMQSPLSETVNPHPMRYIRFNKHASHPNTLTKGDLAGILDSPAFFARKFDERVDDDVLRRLATRIGASLPVPVTRPSHQAVRRP